MRGQTVILHGDSQRRFAKHLVDKAPRGYVLNIRAPTRSNDQNSKLWAMLSDVSRAKPEDRTCSPEAWKNLFMHALGYAVRFELGLDGELFPVGFRSSHLSKEQMSDLIEFIYEYGARHDVVWTEPEMVA